MQEYLYIPSNDVIRPRGFINTFTWAIFGNEDDPVVPSEYKPDSKPWVRKLYWWCRNPMHNLFFYVIGCAGTSHSVSGTCPYTVFNPQHGFAFAKYDTKFPRGFISYQGRHFNKLVRVYAGWRPPRGAFGVRLTFHSEDFE